MKSEILTAIVLASTACGTAALAADFVPPKAYPIDRYEQGWQKNPFTLVTAAVAVQKKPFSDDLVVGSIGGSVDKPTVVVVNKVTRERTTIRSDDDTPNGMKIKSVHSEGPRKERYVEIELSGEVGVLHFDETLIKAVASAAPAGQQNMGGPNTLNNRTGIVQPGMNGIQNGGQHNVNGMSSPQVNGLPATQGGVQFSAQQNPRQPINLPNVTQPNAGPAAGVNAAQPAGSQSPASTVMRRRFQQVPQPAPEP